MSGLLGGFDGAMQDFDPDDLDRQDAPTAVADDEVTDRHDAIAPDADQPPLASAAAASVPDRRPIDPRAQAVADRLLGRHAATPDARPARLHAAVGANTADCTDAGRVVIGRAAGDLVVPLGVVSRAHCAVSRDGGRYTVVDLGSANGTLVCRPGGRTTPVGAEPVELHPGDVITTARGRRPIARLEAAGGTE